MITDFTPDGRPIRHIFPKGQTDGPPLCGLLVAPVHTEMAPEDHVCACCLQAAFNRLASRVRSNPLDIIFDV